MYPLISVDIFQAADLTAPEIERLNDSVYHGVDAVGI